MKHIKSTDAEPGYISDKAVKAWGLVRAKKKTYKEILQIVRENAKKQKKDSKTR